LPEPFPVASSQAVPRRPHFQYETRLISQGFTIVAGLDEVGRGTLAGPVVAGAVILPPSLRQDLSAGGRGSGGKARWTKLVHDSKQLTAAQREEAYAVLTGHCASFATGACDAADIDRMGIVAATRLAMARALDMLDARPDHLLIDALDLPAIRIPQTPIIKGDAASLSIAAASIIAKVTRDRLMETVFEEQFPGYGFAEHKGYGTAEHMAALYRLGPTPIHRLSFAPVREALEGRRPSHARPSPAREIVVGDGASAAWLEQRT
jgi:ribonuclease HII